MLSGGNIRQFSSNQEIFAQGDVALALPVVMAGRVKMTRFLEPGKEVIIGIFNEGDIFAIPPVFDGSSYPSTAVAMTDSKLLFVPREIFLDLLRESDELSFAVIGWMGEMLRNKTAAIQNLASSSPEYRVASVLIRLSKDTVSQEPVKIMLRREDIAKMTGLTTETTIRTVRKLAAKNAVVIKQGKIIVESLEPLKQIINACR